jgi:hypothetical protein
MPADRPEQDEQPPRVLYNYGARDAEEFHRLLAERQLVDEAELLAAGYRFLTVEHGDAEDDEQATLVKRLSDTAWATGRVRRTQGGNDYLTVYVEPPTGDQPNADEVVNQLELLAHELNPGWWRIRRSTR